MTAMMMTLFDASGPSERSRGRTLFGCSPACLSDPRQSLHRHLRVRDGLRTDFVAVTWVEISSSLSFPRSLDALLISNNVVIATRSRHATSSPFLARPSPSSLPLFLPGTPGLHRFDLGAAEIEREERGARSLACLLILLLFHLLHRSFLRFAP